MLDPDKFSKRCFSTLFDEISTGKLRLFAIISVSNSALKYTYFSRLKLFCVLLEAPVIFGGPKFLKNAFWHFF